MSRPTSKESGLVIRLALQSRRLVRVRLTELSLNRLTKTAALEFLMEVKGRRQEEKQSGAVSSMAIGWWGLLVSSLCPLYHFSTSHFSSAATWPRVFKSAAGSGYNPTQSDHHTCGKSHMPVPSPSATSNFSISCRTISSPSSPP